ncbi:MAG: hypothetical protein AAF138_09165 [Planctomycetota bacterium]
MKVKGISLLEQHAEKLVVAVVALIVLAALAFQFLSESNVSVGGRDVPLARAFEAVERDAESVTSAIRDSDPALPEPPEVSIGGRYEELIAAREGEGADVLALGPRFRMNLGGAGEPGPDEDEPFAAFEPPAPSGPVAAVYRGAIDPRDVVMLPGLRDYVASQQPFDAAAITIAARFDGVELERRLESPPAGERPAPRSWRTEIEILTVEAQRQRRLSDGSWSEPEPVASAPSAVDLLGRVSDPAFRATDMGQVLDVARVGRRAIVQPAFYRTLYSAPWNPPVTDGEISEGDDAANPQDARAIELLQRQLQATRRQITNVQDRIERLENQPAPDRRPPPGDGDRRRDPPPGRDNAPDTPTTPLERAEAELLDLQDQEAATIDELEALGVVFDDDEERSEEEGWDPSRLDPLGPVMSNPSLAIWTHDLSAEPGVEYRYRLRPIFNNPYFGQRLTPEQMEMAEAPTAAGDWSDWSEPVSLLDDSYYFVTSASEAGVGPARSTFELYRFYYGAWRFDSVSVEPGDALTGTIGVPVLPIFDMAALGEGLNGDDGRGDEPPPGRGPGRDPGRDPGRNGGRDGDGGRGDGRAPPPDPRRDPDGPAVVADDGPTELQFDIGAVLLDVAPDITAAPGATGGVQVFLYQDGQIQPRWPAVDEGSELYRTLRDAARAAESRQSRLNRP